jgi:hypothetical protein
MMKEPIEEQFKNSLDGFEVPYDAAAWSALSSKLDQLQTPTKPDSGKNWMIGGSAFLAVVLITCAVWLYQRAPVSSSTDQKKNTTAAPKTMSKESSKPETIVSTEGNSSSTLNTLNDDNSLTNEVAPTNVSAVERMKSGDVIITSSLPSNSNNIGIESTQPNINLKKEQVVEKEDKTESQNATSTVVNVDPNGNFIVETLAAICVGNKQSCNNQNACEMLVVKPSGEQISIPRGKNLSLLIDQEGTYHIGRLMNGTFKSESTFLGLASPSAEMQFKEEEAYENGLPVVKLSTSDNAINTTWYIGSKRAPLVGKEVNAHFYHKGDHEITLNVVNENGCSSNEKRSIHISKDYNLLAVTAFDPLSADNRKNTFIPFALTQRSVDFSMIVIDPTDGAVIFETDDATLPWKGTDKRNGQLVESNKAYIWRVLLSNPEEGEPEEYKGTIVRM